MRATRLAAALAALALAGGAAAQERPSDDELFGAPAPEAAPAPPQPAAPAPAATPTPTPASGDRREAELLGGGARGPLDATWSKEREDPLKIGGLLYLRAATTWVKDTPPADWPLSAPQLLDVFLDARPNDRVRGFALGRLTYDPTLVTEGTTPLGTPVTRPQSRGVLDQLYVNFDLERTVFVTAGKQHVKWGTGRFWNPGDFLHPVKKDPLAQFDVRPGMTMVKAHLPWEARGWNLYGMALLEDLAGATTPESGLGTVGHVGGAARAEVVLGGVELGADLAAQRGHAPRFGFDGSTALWDLDLTAEVALTKGRDAPAWRATGLDPSTLAGWERYEVTAVTPQVVAGVSWSWKYSDEDALTLGGEYFYNGAGYDDPHVYPVLIASPYLPLDWTAPGCPLDQPAQPGQPPPKPHPPTAACPVDPRAAFTPFYVGRHYLAASLTLPQPGRWNDTTFVLSAIANLSDGSGIVRLDHSVLLNTYLTLETYLAGHVGKEGGEFRMGFSTTGAALGIPLDDAALAVGTPVLDLGVALRLKL